jgi:hypothetical protein
MPPAHALTLRAWWTSRHDSPYEAAVLFQSKRAEGTLTLDLFRMDPTGYYWAVVQYAGRGPEFGQRAQAVFADVNVDGQPEIVAYQPSEPDSFLELGSGVPPTVQELTFTERAEGFVLHDARAVPGPVETLRMFVTFLVQGDAAHARRLMVRPAALDSLMALGWGKHHGRGAFSVEYGEPGEPWPEWLEMSVQQNSGVRRWIVHFWIQDGRWVIRDLLPVQENQSEHRVVPLPDSLRSKRP